MTLRMALWLQVIITVTIKTLDTLHMEFLYKKLNKSDNFDVSVKDDSFYCIPSKKDVVLKLMFATEEAFKIYKENSSK